MSTVDYEKKALIFQPLKLYTILTKAALPKSPPWRRRLKLVLETDKYSQNDSVFLINSKGIFTEYIKKVKWLTIFLQEIDRQTWRIFTDNEMFSIV